MTHDVAPGTLAVYADVGCPWAFVGLLRLYAARARLGLEDAVRVDVRAFPLEIINAQPTPFGAVQAEIPALVPLTPDERWGTWAGEPTTWPVTTLPAMEAVEAAKAQGLAASEQLDLELRRALFARSECVSLRHVILGAARRCPDVDDSALAEALDDGRARRPMLDACGSAPGRVQGSPHVFAPDGSSAHNAGIEFHWDRPRRAVVVDDDDPLAYDGLLRRAAA